MTNQKGAHDSAHRTKKFMSPPRLACMVDCNDVKYKKGPTERHKILFKRWQRLRCARNNFTIFPLGLVFAALVILKRTKLEIIILRVSLENGVYSTETSFLYCGTFFAPIVLRL